MSGSKLGGLKAAETIKKKFGEDHYIKIGKLSKGYARPGTGFGFMSPEKRREAGRKGGLQKGINHRAKVDKD